MPAMQEPTTTGAVADGRGTSRRRQLLFVAALTVLAAVIGVCAGVHADEEVRDAERGRRGGDDQDLRPRQLGHRR